MKFILNRNKTIASKFGHSIEFKKGEPTHVPPEAWAEVQAHGAISEEDIDLDDDDVALRAAAESNKVTPEQRKAAIFAAFEAIVAENDRESFTGNGLPDTKKLSDMAGFAVKADERTAMWGEYRAAKEGE